MLHNFPSVPSIFQRFQSLMQRRRRARRFGIPYTRDQHWTIPRLLAVAGQECALTLPDDQGTAIAFKDIFISDVYGLERWKQPPLTVLDVGAHAGLFSLAARLYFPHAEIHAYEPNPALWQNLNAQAATGHFTPFAAAVGYRSGRANLSSSGDSVFTQTTIKDSGAVEVVAISEALQRLAGEQPVDLLKLDCEGAEWDIFTDAQAMKRVRNLTLEYHLDSDHTLDQLLSLLKRMSFRAEFVHCDGDLNGRVWASKA